MECTELLKDRQTREAGQQLSRVWKATTKKEGITCSLCPQWIRWRIRGLNCSRGINIRCWKTVLWLVEIMKHCKRFLEEVMKFPSLERFPCVRHWSCPKAETAVEYPPSRDAIDLLILWITRGWPCYQGSGKKKLHSGLDLRHGRFLFWTFPDKEQWLRSHLNLGVCLQGVLFLSSKTSWLFREIVSVVTVASTWRTHSQNRIEDITCNQRCNSKLCIDENMWPDICDVTFSV